ncbi:MAG: O-antigen ligase family protein [Patescibacteria group bacterium]
MRESRIINIIKWLIAASFFTPLIVLSSFYFPLIVPKTLIFQALIECTLFLYILLVISNKSYLPKFDALTKSVLSFFCIFFISAIFGENVFRSFFGTFERMLGIFNLAHFVILFLIAKSIFIKEKDWIFLFRSFVVAGLAVALYGVGQKLGFSFLYNAGTNRIDSTIGNAAFLASYMIFNIFFSIFLIVKDKRDFKFFYIISLFLSFIVLYLSATRGAILGLFLAFLFLLVAMLVKNRNNLGNFFNLAKNRGFALALGGLALFIILFFLSPSDFLEPIKRINSISLSDATTKTRILSAGVSFDGMKEHPIFGWGMENYNLIFDKYYDIRLYQIENWFDHAHNIIFDTLSSAGILGLLSYISIFIVAIIMLLKYKKKDNENFFISYLFIALLLAYFFQNLFVFDSLATYISFFFILAFFVFLTVEKNKTIKKPETPVVIPVQVLAMLLVIFAIVIYNFNIKPALASYYGLKALQVHPKQSNQALAYFKKSFDISLMGKPEMRAKMISYADFLSKDKEVSEDQRRRFFDVVEDELMKSILEEPKNFRYYLNLANMAIIDGGNNAFLQETADLLEKISELAPNKPILYLQRYQIYIMLNKKDKALRDLKKAIELTGDVKLEMLLASYYNKLNDKKSAK